jgi:glycosyltransferase involved in cell wall biosynthesis
MKSDVDSDVIIHFALPYKGDRRYLYQTVTSLIEQSDSNWTLFVLENGKQDEEVSDWILGLKQERITYSFNKTDIGHAANFNLAMKRFPNKWVVLLGADDILDPNFVHSVRKAVRDFPNTIFVHPGVTTIDELGNTTRTMVDIVKKALTSAIPKQGLVSSKKIIRGLMLGNWLYFPSICWNMEICGNYNFNENLPQTLDFDFAVRILLDHQNGGAFLPEVLYKYRRHSHSVSSVGASHGLRFKEERMLYSNYAKSFKQRKMFLEMILATIRPSHRMHVLTKFWKVYKNLGTVETIKIIVA